MSKKTFDITPDISLMIKLGKSGYSSPQAIAELVDNSIDARIDGLTLNLNIKIDRNVISVADNGSGMSQKELHEALTLARSKKKGMLGEFGLGLKTACNSLGSRFEIITSPKGDNKQYKIIFDQEEWSKGKNNWNIEIESLRSSTDDHFTIVKIENLVRYWPQLAEGLRKDLERRFAPFIKKGEIIIKVNGKNCKLKEYELIENSRKEFEIEIEEGQMKGKKIYGWYGLLKEGSNKGLYGFHTYRRGRMITTYDKIAIGEHPTISRIIGEINLDFVDVTHNKKEFIKESEGYSIAEKYLEKEFKDLLKEARRKSGQDKITKNVENELDVWKDKISQVVNNAPDLKCYTAQIDPKTGMIRSDEGEETDLLAEKRDSGENKGGVDAKDTDRQRVPKKRNENKKNTIKVKGKTFEFEHLFYSLGYESAWKSYDFDKKSKKIVIYTNTDFPAYLATKDPVFYAVIHIAEAISEIMIYEVGGELSDIQDIKETILRLSAKLKSQYED